MILVNVPGGVRGRIEQPSNRIYPKEWTGLETQFRAHGAIEVVLAGAATGTVVGARAHRRMRRDSMLLWPRTS